jgi:hypothetical protein
MTSFAAAAVSDCPRRAQKNQAKLATNQLKRDCWVTAVN